MQGNEVGIGLHCGLLTSMDEPYCACGAVYWIRMSEKMIVWSICKYIVSYEQ